jgi:hypothetical protein
VRESLAAINARFHLVGLFTLIDLLLRILLALAGDNPDWSGAVLAALVVAWAGTVAIVCQVFHAASGRPERPPLAALVAMHFLPLLWLQIRLRFLVYLPFLLGTFGWHALLAPSDPAETWVPRAIYLCAPVAETLVALLALYSTPIAVLRRERGARGAPIREGVRLLLAERKVSARLLGLVLPAAGLTAAVQYLQGPDYKDPVPTAPEAFAFFVASYLTLVALFGACRVVFDRSRPAGGRDAGAEPAATAPGPPA